MYKIVFVVRKLNDLDHLLPIIIKCVNEKNKVSIVSLQVSKMNNYLVKYMRDSHGLIIEYPLIETLNAVFKILLMLHAFLSNLVDIYQTKIQMKYVRHVLKIMEKFIINKAKSRINVFQSIFRNLLPDLIVFDKTGMFNGSTYEKVVLYAAHNNIPMVRIAHGPSLRANNTTQPDLLNSFFYKRIYNFFMGKNEYIKSCSNKSPITEKFILGCMRFSKEWINMYNDINKYDDSKKPDIDGSKKTILILESPAGTHIDANKVAPLINSIGRKFDINIIYKPHTRIGVIDSDIVSSISRKIHVHYAPSTSSSWLIEVSDIVLLVGDTGVGLHALIANKPVIVAEYLNLHETLYAKYNTVCISRSEKEVVDSIDDILSKNDNCINSKNVDIFLTDLVRPYHDRNIINDHYMMFDRIIKDNI
jgi:hypothetical protein